ncbi:ribonuclease-like 3 [Scomber scombrus]|uniref:Ribonuclease-like 3 n=1 Tax=Scomber scombrus TaxID=13677 RepID=A0AAV1QMM3_SCOSC
MRIQFVCLLLVLLSATALSLDVEKRKSIRRQFEDFKTQHINEDMTADECDAVIRQRKISFNGKRCKPKNTFIQANIETVKSVCAGKGKPYKTNMTRSTEYFDIVFCNLTSRAAKNLKCHYEGNNLRRRIIIKCKNHLPIHYEDDIDYFEN